MKGRRVTAVVLAFVPLRWALLAGALGAALLLIGVLWPGVGRTRTEVTP